MPSPPEWHFMDRPHWCTLAGVTRTLRGLVNHCESILPLAQSRDLAAEALGRSQGGFSTKIHLRVEDNGKPMTF